MHPPAAPLLQRGFTLVEMIVAIVVAGIAVALVALFGSSQIQNYFAVSARTDLADTADTALRHLARDLHNALPNSVRVSVAGDYVEFVPISQAGRYRAASGGGSSDDPLDFTSATDNSFDVFGPPVTVNAGDWLVIYNLGIPGSDVYAGTNRRALTSIGSNLSNLSYTVGASQFPLASPQSRFQTVSGPVSYQCDLVAGVVRRYWGYAFSSSQPLPPTGGSSSLLASNVTACTFSYAAGVQQRDGLMTLRLTLTENGESVTLLHQVNVLNTP
ncbi:MAG: type II secretion system protein [Paucibacter sp.]|nr:type II secretion system protein [Roseateles sp.]